MACPFNGIADTVPAERGRQCVRTYTVYYGHVAVNAARTQHSPSPPACTDWVQVKMATEGQSEYESVLCVKPEVNVYRIPPRASNRAIRWGGAAASRRAFCPSIRELQPLGAALPRRPTYRAHPLITQLQVTTDVMCVLVVSAVYLQGHEGIYATNI